MRRAGIPVERHREGNRVYLRITRESVDLALRGGPWHAKATALYRSGLTLAQVGKRLGYSNVAVLYALRKLGVERRAAVAGSGRFQA